MATYDQAARGSFASGTPLLAGLSAALQRYRAMRRTFNELSTLSDRELNDLGLGRGDLMKVARESAGY